MLKLFKVQGHSLFPILKEGQRLLALRIFRGLPLKVGDLVVFDHASQGLMIKRIERIKQEGDHKSSYFVTGTDPMSIDSRNFGSLTRCALLYKIIAKL